MIQLAYHYPANRQNPGQLSPLSPSKIGLWPFLFLNDQRYNAVLMINKAVEEKLWQAGIHSAK
jgi:hypothetical protein